MSDLTHRQSQIVDAALRIIATRGSRRFTTACLAREVGITGGALYRHFPGMAEVVEAVIDRVGQILFAGFPPAADDPLERLKLFFDHRVRTILANPQIAPLLLSDHLAQAGGARQAARLDELKRRSRSFVLGCLEEARAQGALAAGLSPGAGAVIVLGAILALAHAPARGADGAQTDRLVAEVWTGIERMLRTSAVAAAARERPQQPRRRLAEA